MNYFTYGRHFKNFEDKYDTTSKRKAKLSIRKKRLKWSLRRDSIRSSRRGSSSNIKNFIDSATRRKNSNIDDSTGLNQNKNTTGDYSSDVESDISKDMSKIGDENFTKSVIKHEDEEVVQEDADEDNTSLLSSKKLHYQKSLRRKSFLKRRDSIKKSPSNLSRLLGNKDINKSGDSLIKLQRTEVKITQRKDRKSSPNDYLYFDKTERKRNLKPNMDVFNNLHEKYFLSSLGRKVAKPKVPKSLYSISRGNSAQKYKRPQSSLWKWKNRSYSKDKSEVSLSKLRSSKNDYWDGHSSQSRGSRQFKSFDKRCLRSK